MRTLARVLPFVIFGPLALPVAGCADPTTITPPVKEAVHATHTVDFGGSVFDGALGSRLTAYSIEASVGGALIPGEVDASGRFALEGIGAFDDYSIAITAEGYRAFLSHNAHVGLPSALGASDLGTFSTHRDLIFDAYVFPASLVTEATTLTVETSIPENKPSGTARLRPLASSVLVDAGDTPESVNGQIWANDEDLQAGVVTKSFTDGALQLDAGELVYGVTYRVDIYDVPDQQPFQGIYKAGTEADKTFTLVEEIVSPLEVVASNDETCKPPLSPFDTSAAVITIELNAPAELGATSYDGGPGEALDDGLVISSPNLDADSTVNTLRSDVSSSLQERVTAVLVNGNKVTLAWNPSSGLDPKDSDEPILEVHYTNLSAITLRRPGHPATQVSLAQLLGKSTITCN